MCEKRSFIDTFTSLVDKGREGSKQISERVERVEGL